MDVFGGKRLYMLRGKWSESTALQRFAKGAMVIQGVRIHSCTNVVIHSHSMYRVRTMGQALSWVLASQR